MWPYIMLHVFVDFAPSQTQVVPFFSLLSSHCLLLLYAVDLSRSLIWSPVQVDPLQTAVFFDGDGVFASLLHHVCHLALCAWPAPEMCQ